MIFITLFSLSIKIIYFIKFNLNIEPIGDEGGYLSISRAFLNYTTTQFDSFILTRSPLSSVIILPFYKIFGYSIDLARSVNIIISTATTPLLFILLSNVFKYNNKECLRISLLYALYPPSIFYSSLILSENLAAFLFIIVCYRLLKVTKNWSFYNLLFLGISLGLLTLTRSSNYYLIIFIIIGLYTLEKIKIKFLFKKSIIIFLAFFIVLSPIITYNYITFGRFLPTEPRMGYGLYLCNNDLNNPDIKKGGYFRDEYLIQSPEVIDNAKVLIDRDDELKSRAIKEILNKPSKLIVPIINRFTNYWSFRPNPMKENYTNNDFIMLIIWAPIFILYFLSFFIIKKRNFLYLDILIIYSCLTILPFFGLPRFRFPIDSLIMIKAFECLKIIINKKVNFG